MRASRTSRLDISSPTGRVTVRPEPSRDRLGDIAAACGVDPRADLYVDGRPADAATLSGVSGIRYGSTVSSRPDAVGAVATGAVNAVVRLVVVAGPAAGQSVELPEGRHLIGRAPAARVPLDDPTIEAHHALLAVGRDGRVTVVQLTGRVPVRAGGTPVTTVREVARGETLEIGASLVAVTTVAERPEPVATGGVPGDPWHVAVLRRPRRIDATEPAASLTVPVATEAGTVGAIGLVGSLAGLAMSVLAATLLGQPMFAIFGALGAVVSLSTWAFGRIRGSRSGRRARRAHAAACATFRAAVDQRAREAARLHLATTATLPGAIAAIGTAALWERRPEHGDAFVVSIGIGDLVRPLPLATAGDRSTGSEPPGDLVAYAESAARLADVPVPVALDDPTHRAIAVVGPHRDAVVRALVVQLAVQTGPADWQLVVVTDDPPRFDWAAWLPHCGSPDGTPAVLDANDPVALADALRRLDDGDERRVVVVADRAGLLATRTSPLRRLLDVERAVTVVVPVADEADVPAVCSAAVTTGTRARGWWRAGGWDDSVATAVHVAGLSESDAAAACRSMARYADPEDPRTAASSLATEVALSALDLPMTSVNIAATWRVAGVDPPPSAPVGMTADGVVEIDLDRDGPHALIAGTTGSGKSELLRTMVVALAACHSPDHLTFVLVDYKGGSTFDACSDLPHTVGLVTDLDDGLAERALVSLDAELHRRERLLRDVGAADLAAYRAAAAAAAGAALPRLAVVIDEFAALARELPDFLAALVGIAQRGRSLGVHLILATQRPAGVVDDSIRANTNLRLALRLHDVSDAIDVVGDPAPARLPRGTPGRCVMRLGPSEVVEFQAARCTIEAQPSPSDVTVPTVPTELELLVTEIRRAVRAERIAAPHRPWLPPLSELAPDELGASEPDVGGALGILDDPAHQCRLPLRWDRRVGNLALLGAIGSGTTTALVSIAAAVALAPPSEVHLYVVDGRGDVALDPLATLAHCGGVVRIHEAERVHRLAGVLVAELERRRGCPADERGPDVVLLVDGLMALRAWLDEPVHAEAREAFEAILRDGAVVGVAVAAVIEPGSGAGVLARFAERWIFHLDDPLDGPTFGVPARRVPPATPGRLVVASTGLAAQLAVRRVPDAALQRTEPADRPVPIGTLPSLVRRGELGVSATAARLATTLPIGLAATSLEPTVITIPDGEHVLVVGPARSGRSTALASLVAAWQDAHRDGRVTIVCPDARSPLAADRRAVASIDHLVDVLGDRSPVGPPTPRRRDLVVIDDAERLDDRAGRLAQLVGLGADGPTLIAAGRPDALRTSLVAWVAAVRRSRLGLVMASAAEHHADFFGGYTPLRTPIAPRPGLAWLFADAPPTLVQLAVTTPKTPELSA